MMMMVFFLVAVVVNSYEIQKVIFDSLYDSSTTLTVTLTQPILKRDTTKEKNDLRIFLLKFLDRLWNVELIRLFYATRSARWLHIVVVCYIVDIKSKQTRRHITANSCIYILHSFRQAQEKISLLSLSHFSMKFMAGKFKNFLLARFSFLESRCKKTFSSDRIIVTSICRNPMKILTQSGRGFSFLYFEWVRRARE